MSCCTQSRGDDNVADVQIGVDRTRHPGERRSVSTLNSGRSAFACMTAGVYLAHARFAENDGCWPCNLALVVDKVIPAFCVVSRFIGQSLPRYSAISSSMAPIIPMRIACVSLLLLLLPATLVRSRRFRFLAAGCFGGSSMRWGKHASTCSSTWLVVHVLGQQAHRHSTDVVHRLDDRREPRPHHLCHQADVVVPDHFDDHCPERVKPASCAGVDRPRWPFRHWRQRRRSAAAPTA
jgi:hypothetical protein